MASQWVEERFRRYGKRLENQKLTDQLRHNALAAYDSFLSQLRDQVSKDVADYNELFVRRSGLKQCSAVFEDRTDGFMVSVGNESVRAIQQAASTIISFQRTMSDGSLRNDFVEIAPDQENNLRYRHEGNGRVDFLGAEEVSELLLDPVLCDGSPKE